MSSPTGGNLPGIDYREHSELYRVGRGEQGVLTVEQYKSEILPYWRFRTPAIAQESAEAIYTLYCEYRDKADFVGMDMARKFLQMGYTRARRYSNHKGGQKYRDGQELPRDAPDPDKSASALIFKGFWDTVAHDPIDVQAKAERRSWIVE